MPTHIRHVGCSWLKFDRFQTWTNNTQHVATHRNTVAKRTQHVAPNNVATCCVGMLRSIGRGLRTLFFSKHIRLSNVITKSNYHLKFGLRARFPRFQGDQFLALGTGYIISRPWHCLFDFARSTLETVFPTLFSWSSDWFVALLTFAVIGQMRLYDVVF